MTTDDFNRANGGLGSGWLAPDWVIDTNRVKRVVGGNDFCVNLTDLGSTDHYSEVDVDMATNSGGAYMCVNVRRQSDNDNQNLYLAYISPGNGIPEIGRQLSGSYSQLTIGPSITGGAMPTGIYRIRLEVEGNELRFYVDDVLVVSTTDSAVTSGTYAGLNGSSGSEFYDNFEANTFAPPEESGEGHVSATGSLIGSGQTVRQGSGSISAVSSLLGQGYSIRSGSGAISAVSQVLGLGYDPNRVKPLVWNGESWVEAMIWDGENLVPMGIWNGNEFV